MAGIIGARTWGVAPSANLINVKITNNNCGGAATAMIAQAILDIIDDHKANKAKDYTNNPLRFRGSIINLSLGWEDDDGAILDELIKANEAGIRVYTAAGNQNKNAGNTYPCANVRQDSQSSVSSQ